MASDKQIEANRLNSEKSTGPKTEKGKAIVSKNAIKHGLFSSETILPWENSDELEILRQKLYNTLKPEGELENVLVDRLISLSWRLCRTGRIETAIFIWRKYGLILEQSIVEQKSYIKNSPLEIDQLFTLDDLITDKDKYNAASREVSKYSTLANAELPALGRTFTGDSDTFLKLHKIEIGIEKSFFKALHELQRLQAFRLGQDVRLPVAIDVHGDCNESAF